MKPWTEAEILALKQRFPVEPVDVLAESLNRAPHSVRCKANQMGIRKTQHRNKNHPRAHQWTDADDAELRRLWLDVRDRVKGHTAVWAARQIGVTVQQAIGRASVLGLRKGRLKEPCWSDEELDLLSQWLHLPPPAIRHRLQRRGFHRTESAIVVQRWRKLGGLAMATGGYSATQLGELLGTNARTISRWIEKKWLPATPRGNTTNAFGGPGDRWIITPADVRKFIINHPIYINNQVNIMWLIELLAGKPA